MFKQLARFTLISFCFAIAACGSGGPTEQDARRMASEYYEALKRGDVDAAVRTLGGEQDAETWRYWLSQRMAQKGALQSYELRKVDVNTVYSGMLFVMDVDVVYPNGKSRETLTLGEPVTDGELKILSVHDEGGKPRL